VTINSTQSTVNENIKKATRALYSLMGVGLHGENGIDPETTISLLRTYVLPILYYGLEITCSCLSASLHSIEVCSDLAMFPKNVKTFICISASIGNRPDSI
jgi:hypothetical protein